MCMSKPKIPAPAPQAPALPTEVVTPATVDRFEPKRRKTGRNRLKVPESTGSSTTGMSGLNIPM